MRKSQRTGFVALAAAAVHLAGCARDPEPPRSVSYYRAHADERTAAVARCADDPGQLGREPDCINARRAAAIEDIGSFDKLPPMGLTPNAPQTRDPDDPHSRVRP
jgi:hypothetical protein